MAQDRNIFIMPEGWEFASERLVETVGSMECLLRIRAFARRAGGAATQSPPADRQSRLCLAHQLDRAAAT